MATKIGSVVIDIDARLTKMEANLAKANRQLGSFDRSARSVGNKIEGTFKKIGTAAVAMAAAFASTQLISFARQSLDATGGLGELAQQLGVTTDQLQIYQYAATQAGLKNEELQTSLGQLSRRLGQASLGVKAPAEAFKILGVEVKNADGTIRRTGQVLPDIAEALSKIESPAQRAALATELFGRSGQKLLPILESGRKGLNEYEQAARKLGVVLSSEQIAKADEAADKLAALNLVLSKRFDSVVADNAGSIIKLGEALGGLVGKLLSAGTAYDDFFLKLKQRAAEQKAQGPSGLQWLLSPGTALFGMPSQEERLAARQEASNIAQERLQLRGLDASTQLKNRYDRTLGRVDLKATSFLNPTTPANDGALGGTTLGSVFGTAGKDKAVKGLFDDFKSPDVEEFFRKQEESSRRVAELFAETESIIVTGVDNKSRSLVRSLDDIVAEIEGPATAAFETWAAKREEELTRLDDFAQQFAATFSGAFEDALLSGDLDGALDGLLEDMARLIIRLTVIEPLARAVKDAFSEGGGGFGGFITAIGSVFGGGKALGGNVTGGTEYLVGERGPEKFTPKVDGHITPANDLGSEIAVTVTPSPYFDVRVERVSSGVVNRSAPAIVNAATQNTMQRASRRRLPGGLG